VRVFVEIGEKNRGGTKHELLAASGDKFTSRMGAAIHQLFVVFIFGSS